MLHSSIPPRHIRELGTVEASGPLSVHGRHGAFGGQTLCDGECSPAPRCGAALQAECAWVKCPRRSGCECRTVQAPVCVVHSERGEPGLLLRCREFCRVGSCRSRTAPPQLRPCKARPGRLDLSMQAGQLRLPCLPDQSLTTLRSHRCTCQLAPNPEP